MRNLYLILTSLLIIIGGELAAQISHSVFLIGNTTELPKEESLTSFQKLLEGTSESFTVVHLGDLSGKDTLQTKSNIERLVLLTKDIQRSKMYIVPGDKDWGNSKKNGWKKVKEIEEMVERLASSKKIFLPTRGCPGPEIIDLSDNLRIIAINSQWWMHPHEKPSVTDDNCKCRTKQEFLDKLEDVLSESSGKNVLLIGHHPVISQGTYGGKIPLKRHFFPFENPVLRYVPLPVIGSIYAAYRQNVGTPRDMANTAYEEFAKGMKSSLLKFPGLIYAASHDYNLQLNYSDGNYHIVSGSFTQKERTDKGEETVFSKSKKGFTKIEYYTNGDILSRYYEINDQGIKEIYSKMLFQSVCNKTPDPKTPFNPVVAPCIQKTNDTVNKPFPQGNVTMVGSEVYKAGFIKRSLLGSRYRKEWQQPVSMPYLNLDTAKGGLVPFGKGGGRQTLSLKLKGGDGKEYVFRSVDKDFTRTLAPQLRNTFLEPILRDVTSTQHPYGALAVSRMLDETDILHARPELYVLPDHPSLGAFQTQFANMPGLLEDRPMDGTSEAKGFMGADKVVQSVTLFQKMFENHDNRVNVENYGKSKVFDMLIGDWGRHQDNLKWAGYKNEKATIYYPIPRDRDHAFSRWNGLVSWIADRVWIFVYFENFGYDFRDIRSLTFNARHIDRFLLNSFTREDWKKSAQYIQSKITDAVIDSAIMRFPVETRNESSIRIAKRLKNRRAHLEKAVEDYYLLLAKEVDVVGSNKNEKFEVERMENGNVRVRMWGLKKDHTQSSEPLFDREFIKGETDEIRLYGLDGEDVFSIKGTAKNSILVRVIGGEGKDQVIDESKVKGLGKKTRVYDKEETILAAGTETKVMAFDDRSFDYDRQDFVYSKGRPAGGIFYNSNDGFGLSAGISYKKQAFRKEGYKAWHTFKASATTRKNLYIDYKSEWKHAIKKIDLVTKATAGGYYPSFNFYGYGNDTKKYQTLFDNGNYRILNSGFSGGFLLQRRFFKLASIHAGPVFELNRLVNEKAPLTTPEIKVNPLTTSLVGVETVLDLDLRDKKQIATRGMRFYGSYTPYYNFTKSSTLSVLETFYEYYGTFKLLLPMTVAVEIGGSKTYGKNIPLYKYSFLGQKNHLRGYVRNRFTGDMVAYLNTELRINLGKVDNPFLPFYVGVFGFKDFGKVWYKGTTSNWHTSEGAGIFVAPISTRFTMRVSVEHSKEDMLLDIGAGFYLDK